MFTEETLESATIAYFKEIGYEYLNCSEIARADEGDVILFDRLEGFLQRKYGDVQITENELKKIENQIISSSGSLYKDNLGFIDKVTNGFIIRRDDPRKKDIRIDLIDYDNIENNDFLIVNQFIVQGPVERRIPDMVLFINGLPLVVFEYKSAVREDTTIENAYTQLTSRYRRDIPEIFKYNAFCVISDGVNNRYGSIFTPYEFYYSWNKVNSEDEGEDGIGSLSTMIYGMFTKKRILDIIHDFIYFPDVDNNELKIICRYPQYFASVKLFDHIKEHMKPKGDGKGGTYFGSTGCGKSYTMLFLSRLLMQDPEMKNPTIVLITDRTDLDDQLADQFVISKKYIRDDCIEKVESREDLREKLLNRASGGVYLTTIQKFSEEISLLSDRANIICMSDEAHRTHLNLDQKIVVGKDGVTQTYGFAKYLRNSLPNATYVGFTGTPIDATLEVFGEVVDQYTMVESVRDGITVDLVYEGRATKVYADSHILKEIDEYYKMCEEKGANPNQVQLSKQLMSNIRVIMGNPKVLERIADDFINHYERRVSEGSSVLGKALVVFPDRKIAFDFYKILISKRPEWAVPMGCTDPNVPEEKREKVRPTEKLHIIATRGKDDPEEMYNLLGTKEDRMQLDRQFKDDLSNFKIAIVVDMWLTGFDVPSLDTIYINKPLQKHTLIQTISRVNRVYKGKTAGLVVDYLGIKNQLNDAISMYTNGQMEEFIGIERSLKIVLDRLESLEEIMHGFDKTDYFSDDPCKQLDCLKRASELVQKDKQTEDLFMKLTKEMKQGYNICVNSDKLSNKERDLVHFYIAIRSILFKYTKGRAPDTTEMNNHVRDMIMRAIDSDEVMQVFGAGSDDETEDLFSEEYLEKIKRIPFLNTKIKILQKLLKDGISKYKKVNKLKADEYSERMNKIIDLYNLRKEEETLFNEVSDELIALLEQLREEIGSAKNMGMLVDVKAYYDILKKNAENFDFEFPEDKMKEMAAKIKGIVDSSAEAEDWNNREDVKAEMRAKLKILMAEYGYPPVTITEVYKSVIDQAENRKMNQ